MTRISTYAELVTSVINPSHRFSRRYLGEATSQRGESLMPSVNDELTVTELIHLVTFLKAQYELREYEETPYTPYYYGP